MPHIKCDLVAIMDADDISKILDFKDKLIFLKIILKQMLWEEFMKNLKMFLVI